MLLHSSLRRAAVSLPSLTPSLFKLRSQCFSNYSPFEGFL